MQLDPHYTEPRLAALYDLDSPWAEDTDFYLALAGDRPIDIIDVGCGTGTLALGYAGRGHRVVGVDPAPAMLDVARLKDVHGQVHWVNAAADGLRLDSQADLVVMTGHAFQALLTDQQIRAALQNFRTHLQPGGRIVFETRNPSIDWESRWRRESVWQTADGDVRQVRSPITINGELVSFRHTWTFADGELVSDSTLRFAPLTTLQALIESCGLVCTNLYGDWHRGTFNERESLEMIFELAASEP